MRAFVAGGTGVIGRRLVPQLVARGHQVIATTTSPTKVVLLEQLGAEGIVMDGLDAAAVGEGPATPATPSGSSTMEAGRTPTEGFFLDAPLYRTMSVAPND